MLADSTVNQNLPLCHRLLRRVCRWWGGLEGGMNLVSFSGGKDSTAMLLMMLERGERVDRVLYFDCGSWEFPQMQDHISRVEEYTGIKVERLRYKHTFDYLVFEHTITRGPRKGMVGLGWPSRVMRWCTHRKVETLAKEQSAPGSVVCIGYAAGEEERQFRAKKKYKFEERYPLIEWGVTEDEATGYCKERGFDWGGLYDHFKRVSCWCCPLQPLSALRTLRARHPDLWSKLLDMDKRSSMPFTLRYSAKDLEEKFCKESA